MAWRFALAPRAGSFSALSVAVSIRRVTEGAGSNETPTPALRRGTWRRGPNGARSPVIYVWPALASGDCLLSWPYPPP